MSLYRIYMSQNASRIGRIVQWKMSELLSNKLVATQPFLMLVVKLIVFNIFCPWNSAGERCLKIKKNSKIYSRKTSRVLTVKAVLELISSHSKNIMADKCLAKPSRILLLTVVHRSSRGLHEDIVCRANWLGNPANIKVENNGAVGYVGSTILCFLFTNYDWINYYNVSIGQ